MFLAAGVPLAVFLRGRLDTQVGGHSLGAAVRQALADRSFHFLFWSYAVCGFHTAFITLHLPAFLTDGGLTATHGATAIALIGLFNVAGCFYAGKLGERYSKKTLFAAWMGLFWLGTVPLTQEWANFVALCGF